MVANALNQESKPIVLFWKFLEAVRLLPVQGSIERLVLLFAFYSAPATSKNNTGVSIAWIADYAKIPTEIARHQIRMLRAEGAIQTSGRIGRTELFSLTEKTRLAVGECLSVFERVQEKSAAQASNLVTIGWSKTARVEEH